MAGHQRSSAATERPSNGPDVAFVWSRRRGHPTEIRYGSTASGASACASGARGCGGALAALGTSPLPKLPTPLMAMKMHIRAMHPTERMTVANRTPEKPNGQSPKGRPEKIVICPDQAIMTKLRSHRGVGIYVMRLSRIDRRSVRYT
jgi:hypothetical protein